MENTGNTAELVYPTNEIIKQNIEYFMVAGAEGMNDWNFLANYSRS